MDNSDDKIVLTGETAIEKFLAGKTVWSAYVAQYPEADVNFSEVDFSQYREAGKIFDFRGYVFPDKGVVDFSRATFGEGEVNFFNATFGEGKVDFSNANFGEGGGAFHQG